MFKVISQQVVKGLTIASFATAIVAPATALAATNSDDSTDDNTITYEYFDSMQNALATALANLVPTPFEVPSKTPTHFKPLVTKTALFKMDAASETGFLITCIQMPQPSRVSQDNCTVKLLQLDAQETEALDNVPQFTLLQLFQNAKYQVIDLPFPSDSCHGRAC